MNYNENLETLDYSELQRTGTTWVRGFMVMPEVDDVPPASHPDIRNIIAARTQGYKTILSLKWPYYDHPFPKPGSAEFQHEIERLDRLLPVIVGKTDIIVIGNEPFIESRVADRGEGLNFFYEKLADRIITYWRAHCTGACGTRLYRGALNRLDLPDSRTKTVERFLRYIHDQPDLDGMDIHIHVPDVEASPEFLSYLLPRMRAEQKFLVTEFSLVWWWKQHNLDSIPVKFAQKYGIPPETKVYQVINMALEAPFEKAKWDDFLSMSPWFESHRHYIRDQFRLLDASGRLLVATYGIRQMWPHGKEFTATTPPWLLNSIFAAATVKPNPDGSASLNYAWIDDFRALQPRKATPQQPR